MSYGRVMDRAADPNEATPMGLAARRMLDRALVEQDTRRRALLDEARALIAEQPGQVGVWIRQIERGRARATPDRR